MKTSSLISCASAALFATLALAPFADARFEKNLPAETYGLIQINNIADSQKRLEAHPLSADLKKANFEKFFAPLFEKLKEEAKTSEKAKEAEKTFEAVKKHLAGEVVFAVVNTEKPLPGHEPYDYVLFADTTADEQTIEDIMNQSELFQEGTSEISEYYWLHVTGKSKSSSPAVEEDDEEVTEKMLPVVEKRVTEKYNGVMLHMLSQKVGNEDPINCDGWALVGKTFVYASAPNVLKDLVDAEKSGRKDGFAAGAQWKDVAENAAKADAFAMVNIPEVAKTLRVNAEKTMKETPPTGIFAVNYVTLCDTLALEAGKALWMSAKIEPEQVLLDSTISYSEKKGIFSLFNFKPLANPVPDYIPAGVSNFSAAGFDLSRALADFEAMVKKTFPMAISLDGDLQQLKQNNGIDLRADLLENFGDEIVTVADFSGMSSGGERSLQSLAAVEGVTVFSLKDQAKLETLIGTAVNIAGGAEVIFDERTYMGVKIRTVKDQRVATTHDHDEDTEDTAAPMSAGDAPVQQMPQYAIHNGKFLLSQGNPKLLEKIIAQMADGQNPAAKDPEVKNAAKLFPKDGVSFGYCDLGGYIDYMANIFVVISQMQGEKIVDPDHKPNAKDVPWVIVSSSVENKNSLESRSVIYRKTEKK